jgi:hypothetical protein
MFVVLWIESFIDVDVSFKFDDKLFNIEAFHDIPSQSSDNLHCKYPRIDPRLINISAWSQRRHFIVQAIERIVRDHLHALPHISHGYFIGPGFGWQSDAFDVSRAKI